MPNPVVGLRNLSPCPACSGHPVARFEMIGGQPIGEIVCAKCGRSTLRRSWIEAKREWNGGPSPSLDETLVE